MCPHLFGGYYCSVLEHFLHSIAGEENICIRLKESRDRFPTSHEHTMLAMDRRKYLHRNLIQKFECDADAPIVKKAQGKGQSPPKNPIETELEMRTLCLD